MSTAEVIGNFEECGVGRKYGREENITDVGIRMGCK